MQSESGRRDGMGWWRAHGAEKGGQDFVQVTHQGGEEAGIGRAVRSQRPGYLVHLVSYAEGAPAVERVGERDLGR